LAAALTQAQRELAEARRREKATAEVLRIIGRSAFDLKSVLQQLIGSAVRISGALNGSIHLRDGGTFLFEESYGLTPEIVRFLAAHRLRPDRATIVGRVALSGGVETIADVLADTDFDLPVHQLGKVRSVLGAPLLREGEVQGVLVLCRSDPGEFDPSLIELAESFADQAVIAIENSRLFDEVQAKTRDLEESLAQQTATADVLRVISRSVFDLDAVLNTLTESARSLSGAATALLYLRDGEVWQLRAESGCSPEFREYETAHPFRSGRETVAGRVLLTGETAHIPDVLADPDYRYGPGPQIGDYRALFGVPLIRDSKVEGVFVLLRPEPNAFTPRHIELVRTFADQAVIAIENLRLFDEVQAKTRDLEEALGQQTATANVLKVISRSAFDLPTVLQTLVESAARLCEADKASIVRRIGGAFYSAETFGFSREFVRGVRDRPIEPTSSSATGRALLEGRIVHIPDVEADPDYTFHAKALGGYRAILAVPMLREGEPAGVLVLIRSEDRPFTDRQKETAATFADEAAIAIENARLFGEVQARTEELGKELAAARQLQLSMVPRHFPAWSEAQPIEIQAVMEPAREVGGDLYDFFLAAPGKFCFVVGDVSGKGTAAALFMARTRSLVRATVALWHQTTGAVPAPSTIVQAVNRELCLDNSERMFVTVFLATLDLATGEVAYANAGHPAPYLMSPGSTPIAIPAPSDVPLGIQSGAKFRDRSMALREHEALCLVTDGVLDALNPSEEFFGKRRLTDTLAGLDGDPPSAIVSGVLKAIDDFADGTPRFDDVTLLALRWSRSAPLEPDAGDSAAQSKAL